MANFPYVSSVLFFECRNRHLKNSVKPSMGSVGHTTQNTQYLRRRSLGVDFRLPISGQQIIVHSVDLVCTQLDCKGTLLSIRQFYDSIIFPDLCNF